MGKCINLTRVVIFLTGVIASLSLAAMHEDGRYDLNQFYDAGTVYNYQSQSYNISTETVIYNLENNTSTVQADEAQIQYLMETKDYPWNYLICNIGAINTDNMDWTIEFVNQNAQVLGTQEWSLKKGENILFLNGQYQFQKMNIYIRGQKGLSYTIDSMVFRDKLSEFSLSEFAFWSGLYLLLYLVLVQLFLKYWKKRQSCLNCYKVVEWLQTVYIRVGSYGVGRQWQDKKRVSFRKSLFFLLFLTSWLLTNLEVYSKETGCKYAMAICMLFLGIISFVSVEKPLTRKNWNTPVAAGWITLWIMSVISDFLVDKFYFLVGWMMIFVFGFFYFVIQNMKNPYQIIDDFTAAIRGTFWFNIVFCFFTRPENPLQRYCGFYKNPNVYSFYLTIVLIVFLLELDKCSLQTKIRQQMQSVVGICLVLYQIWLTQSLTGVIMVFVIGMLWLLRRRMIYHTQKREQNAGQKIYRRYYVLSVFAGVFAVFFLSWGINHVPQLLGTQIIFPEDFYQLNFPALSMSMDVYAAELNFLKDSRLYQKVFQAVSLDSLSTGRAAIYMQFIQNMNLWGHYYKLDIAGAKMSAHNELLGMAFRYGVFAVIPYIVFLWSILKRAWKQFFREYRENPYVVTLLAILLVSLIKLSVDKFEQPFRSVGWMAFYFLTGFFFCKDDFVWRKCYVEEDKAAE